jgi:hypothetical protein
MGSVIIHIVTVYAKTASMPNMIINFAWIARRINAGRRGDCAEVASGNKVMKL